MHECAICKESKPKDSFYLNKKGNLRSPRCKSCYNKLQYERQKEIGYKPNRKPEAIEKLKESQKAYRNSERGREIFRKANKKYRETEGYKKIMQEKRINPHIIEINIQLRSAKAKDKRRLQKHNIMTKYQAIADTYNNQDNSRIEIQWKDINGFEHYSISNYGNVYSYISGKLLNLILCHTHGYYKVNLYSNNKRKTFKVHRLVAEAFISNPFNKEEINHIDSNRINNYVGNLEWATRQENQAHRVCNYFGLINND